MGTRFSAEIIPIVAMAHGRVIGRGNALPWRLPEDLRHFRELTTGHPVVMGRRTFESIGRPLANRLNVVVSRNSSLEVPEGVRLTRSLEDALHLASGTGAKVFVIGGAEIYGQVLPIARRIEATLIATRVEDGDARFPMLDPSWHVELGQVQESAQQQIGGSSLRFCFSRFFRDLPCTGCVLCQNRNKSTFGEVLTVGPGHPPCTIDDVLQSVTAA